MIIDCCKHFPSSKLLVKTKKCYAHKETYINVQILLTFLTPISDKPWESPYHHRRVCFLS